MDCFINSAILHILDFSSNTVVYSDTTLNMDDSMISSYVKKKTDSIMQDVRVQEAKFNEGSSFKEVLDSYTSSDINFVEFTKRVTKKLEGYLKNTASKSYDVLFIDFTYGEQPYISFVLLENQSAITHLSTHSDGLVSNIITNANSILPSASKKPNTFAIIQKASKKIELVDRTDWNSGDIKVLEEMILDCTSQMAKDIVLKEVDEVVKEVAIKADVNPTLLLSKYKNYVQESVEEDRPLTTEALATEVFNESEEMQNAFIETSLEHELPKEVEVPKQYSRKMKQQKIKTDTGIELSFPTEYSDDNRFIEFVPHNDGTFTIEIKNIGKITNKA